MKSMRSWSHILGLGAALCCLASAYAEEPAQPSTPKIVSLPDSLALSGTPYFYSSSGRPEVRAAQPVEFYLAGPNRPAGATIDRETGEIFWVPTEAECGLRQFDLVARNAAGTDTQTLTVNVQCPKSSPEVGCSTGAGFSPAALLSLLLLLPRRRRA